MIQYVRPLLAYTGLWFWGVMIISHTPYPAEFQWVVLGMVTWFFGDRTITKLRGK